MGNWTLQREGLSLEESCLRLEDWQAEWLWQHPNYMDLFFYGPPKREE